MTAILYLAKSVPYACSKIWGRYCRVAEIIRQGVARIVEALLIPVITAPDIGACCPLSKGLSRRRLSKFHGVFVENVLESEQERSRQNTLTDFGADTYGKARSGLCYLRIEQQSSKYIPL